jgi:GNAT superfamily N-acetyltransferase
MRHVGNLRRAVPGDAADLTRLRALMYEAMGIDASAAAWRASCETAFTRRLAEPDRFAAFVVEAGGRLVSCGVGWMEEHLPGPRQLDGRRGHIASMSTEPAHQRRGHARAVFAALLEWFASYDVPRVDLRATPDGLPLYEAFGFRELGGATMAWTVAGVAPGMPLLPDAGSPAR